MEGGGGLGVQGFRVEEVSLHSFKKCLRAFGLNNLDR